MNLGMVEAVLPAVKATAAAMEKSAAAPEQSESTTEESAGAPERPVSTTEESWELQPEASDATLSVPASMHDDTDSMIGRLCYLGPKVWLLCYVHCTTLSSAAIALANLSFASGTTVFGILALVFPAWCTFFLAAGLLEAVVRRYVWLRLLEHGLMIEPDAAEVSTEYRTMVGGLLLMATSAWALLGADGYSTAASIVG